MIILTGGAGFIGSVFLSKLNAEGVEDIIVVDDLKDTAKWKNLVGKVFEDYVHKSDFLKIIGDKTRSLKPQVVIHLGACTSTTETDAEYMLDNNYRYSGALAEWALGHKARFIYASSAATYGNGDQGFDDNEADLLKLHPLNVYGYSKQLFDLWADRNGTLRKIAGLKFFNVYGPNEYQKGDMASVVFKAYKQIRETGKVQLFKSYRPDFKDGRQKRDFIYVKDVANVLWWLMNNSQVNGLFNLGSGKARTWEDLARSVFVALGQEPLIEYIDMPVTLRDKYQYFTEAKMEKLRGIGYSTPFTSLEDGVADYVKNYLQKTHPEL